MAEINDYAITHGGKFHADDVFSSALLKIVNPNIKITRAFEVPTGFEGIAFDIGYGKFDHHQEGAEIRENGVPYAAFGLLWREYGQSIIDVHPIEQAAKEAEHFDERFIQPLDEDDNTGGGNQLAGVISSFNPNWDSDESMEECFEQAVQLATVILKKKLDSIVSVQRARTLVQEALAQASDNIVILPKFAPWRMILIKSDADFVVFPSQRGGYNAQAIPADTDTKELKCSFPEEWAGKPEQELQRISGIDSLQFCHKSRFLISAGSLEDVIKACKLARMKAK